MGRCEPFIDFESLFIVRPDSLRRFIVAMIIPLTKAAQGLEACIFIMGHLLPLGQVFTAGGPIPQVPVKHDQMTQGPGISLLQFEYGQSPLHRSVMVPQRAVIQCQVFVELQTLIGGEIGSHLETVVQFEGLFGGPAPTHHLTHLQIGRDVIGILLDDLLKTLVSPFEIAQEQIIESLRVETADVTPPPRVGHDQHPPYGDNRQDDQPDSERGHGLLLLKVNQLFTGRYRGIFHLRCALDVLFENVIFQP